MTFRIFTVGWEPDFADYLLTPMEKPAGVSFVHGLMGDASRLSYARGRYPRAEFVALSKTGPEALPEPDLELLARLEGPGLSTIKSMIQGDRVLRYRSENESLGYATLLARKLYASFQEVQPDLILASFDSLHSALSLGVAKSLGIPWVAMVFPVIPDTLTGFCSSLTPNSLLPLGRPVDDLLLESARALIRKVRSKEQKILAFRPPSSLAQWLQQYMIHASNLVRRRRETVMLGVDRFTFTTARERLADLARRSINRLCLPSTAMLHQPPDTRFAYYPFHMAPESMLDTWAPFYQNQLAFLAQLALAMPADLDFVVKLHFSDPDNYSRSQLQALMKLPRLRIVHPGAAGFAFIEKAALVVGIQGTSCLEAALLGKPVLLFGDSPYLNFPRSRRAHRPDELHVQIRGMLELPPPSEDEIVHAYAAYMARYMPGRINDWARPIEAVELEKLSACFSALRAHVELPANRATWYRQPPFVDAAAL